MKSGRQNNRKSFSTHPEGSAIRRDLSKGTDRALFRERKILYQRRLEEMAYVLSNREKRGSKISLSVAMDLRSLSIRFNLILFSSNW